MTADQESRAFQVEALVRRARVLTAERKSLDETIKALTAKIDELVDVGWKAEIDGIMASKRLGNRTFNKELAIARMTEAQKLACIQTGIDAKKVREIADNEGWTEDCMQEPDDKVRVVLQ